MSTITPYLDNLEPWSETVKNKYILFDTDAIISILEYNSVILCDEFNKLGVTFCLIHPVYVELLKTENAVKRIDRQTFLNDYKFIYLPLTIKEMDIAKDIQQYLLTSKSFTASPTDVYLGGRLGTLSNNSIYLFTANLTDFPYPLFIRKAGIVLQSNKSCKILHLLQLDKSELEKINFKSK